MSDDVQAGAGAEAAYLYLDKVRSPADIRDLDLDQLAELAREMRRRMVEVVSSNGGHIGASLGAVEIAIALHRLFDSPRDKLIWDTGHQAHGHKLLSGRFESFKTFRQLGGIAGFPRRKESEHDVFDVGHAGTALSLALGQARARDLRGEDYQVVAIVGDSALASGMAQEALNNAGQSATRLIVVLNDNAMSISPAVGLLTGILNRVRLSAPYRVAKQDVEPVLAKTPLVGRPMHELLRMTTRGVKAALTPAAAFEQLGFEYLGPIDGHDIGTLLYTLAHARTLGRPVIVHAHTVKGKGYAPAEADQQKWHAVTPFDPATGEIVKVASPAPRSFTHHFSDAMLELGEEDERVVAITAGMPSGTMLEEFARRWPARFFDVGIAEEHAVAFAAGLANGGQRPVVAIYSTFLQRGFDQVIHDVALQEVPVVFAVDRAGLVGEDGTTHHGVFDLSYLGMVPNMTVLAPRDGAELRAMLRQAVGHHLPVAIRWPRGAAPERTPLPAEGDGTGLGSMLHSEVMREGAHVLLYAAGTMANTALEAAALLELSGIEAAVVNARALKPLDMEVLLAQLEGKALLVTLEENVLCGGFGSQVALELAAQGTTVSHLYIGLPDGFVEHGGQRALREIYGLDARGVATQVAGRLRHGLAATANQ